jgi:hypothetical protein
LKGLTVSGDFTHTPDHFNSTVKSSYSFGVLASTGFGKSISVTHFKSEADSVMNDSKRIEQRENCGGRVKDALFLREERTAYCCKVSRQCPVVLPISIE